MVSVERLFANARLEIAGSVPWGSAVPLRSPGVYVITTTDHGATIDTAEDPFISDAAVRALIAARPGLTVDGVVPSATELAARLAALRVPNEPVLYVGMSTKPVRKRVRQFVQHQLGNSSPHKGGWPVKLLASLDQCSVFFAASDDPALTERTMLGAFASSLSVATIASLHDSNHPMPFANLEYPKGIRKRHGIRGASPH